MEACRCNQEFVEWREKNNWEVARMFKFMCCDTLDGLSHVRGQCQSQIHLCSVVWGWARGPYSSHLGCGYPEIRLLQFVGDSGGL